MLIFKVDFVLDVDCLFWKEKNVTINKTKTKTTSRCKACYICEQKY